MMNPDPDKLNAAELGQQEPSSQAAQGGEYEEDVLDTVFNKTDRLCCGFGKEKAKTTETTDVAEGDLQQDKLSYFDEEHEQADESFAAQQADPSQTHNVSRKASTAKESVEIKANFDEKDEGVTIVSNNGLENGDDGYFVSDEKPSKETRRRSLLRPLLIAIVLFVLLVGLVAGFTRRNNRNNASSSVASAALTGEGQTGNETQSPEGFNMTDDDILFGNTTGFDLFDTPSPTAAPTTSTVGTGSPTVGDNTTETGTGGPTAAPTVLEVGSTPPPTSFEPETTSDCNSVSVNASCYEFFQDEIVISFNLCDPDQLDWVALYPEGTNMTDLEDPGELYRYTCGSTVCNEAVQTGTVTVDLNTPPPPGKYQAYLVPNVDGQTFPPFLAVAISEPFEVTVGTCE